ncbi:MAG: hypothetical protein K2X27_00155, partial [Candidatus Obscuribacterales bacterium]|nr:hypothetical protein [Candidatus Obscuribacterales bacterium]
QLPSMKKLSSAIASIFLSLIFQGAANAADSPWADFSVASNVVVQAVDQYAYYQDASYKPNLSPSVSSMPAPNSYYAPSNLALRAVKRNTLPPTKLDSFVTQSGKRDDIYGMEGRIENTKYSPIGSGFDPVTADGLTTGQESNAPSVYYFHPMAANPPQ